MAVRDLISALPVLRDLLERDEIKDRLNGPQPPRRISVEDVARTWPAFPRTGERSMQPPTSVVWHRSDGDPLFYARRGDHFERVPSPFRKT